MNKENKAVWHHLSELSLHLTKLESEMSEVRRHYALALANFINSNDIVDATNAQLREDLGELK
jgi:regulator of replication initiation timing